MKIEVKPLKLKEWEEVWQVGDHKVTIAWDYDYIGYYCTCGAEYLYGKGKMCEHIQIAKEASARLKLGGEKYGA